MLKDYYQLTKPGIIYGNAMTTLAAFLFASRWHFSFELFVATLLGIAFIIGSACVFNNYLDREIDAKMARTKDRALVAGRISPKNALVFASALGFSGFALLIVFVNTLTALVALTGFIFYVFFYTFSKRYSPLGTLVGSVSGATPIVVGYSAVTNRLDTTALLLFLILVSWQMPHFYAIAIRRIEEYRAASIPVLPIAHDAKITKLHIVVWIVLYLICVCTLTFAGFAGTIFLIVTLIANLSWLVLAARGLQSETDEHWAEKLFLCSLVVLLVFSVALSLASVLP